MKVVIAPDKFKESLDAPGVCSAIADGLRTVWPDAELDLVPMADGGDGTVEALVAATNGKRMHSVVHGPLGQEVEATWGILGGTQDEPVTAIMEMASASGLALVKPEDRNPLLTSTLGTGELIHAGLNAGATQIILGIGGSATTDGGAGAAQAVGVVFEDEQGRPLAPGLSGGSLDRVTAIRIDELDPRLAACGITVACDVDNPLCGPNGAAAVFGPQKGASEEIVSILDANLDRFASLIRKELGKDVRDIPGAGAAGGLGAGMMAFFGATLKPGVELVMDAVGLPKRLAGADLVITGEGRLDGQSMMGKVVGGVAAAAGKAGVPTIALAGGVGHGAENSLRLLDAYFSVVDRPLSLSQAMKETPTLLTRTAINVARLWQAGARGATDRGRTQTS